MMMNQKGIEKIKGFMRKENIREYEKCSGVLEYNLFSRKEDFKYFKVSDAKNMPIQCSFGDYTLYSDTKVVAYVIKGIVFPMHKYYGDIE